MNLPIRLPFVGLLCFFVALFALSGCRPAKDPRARNLVPAKGHITMDDEPLAGATIIFIPSEDNKFDSQSSTFSDLKGYFELTTFTPGDGIHPGNYSVTVLKNEYSNSISDEEIARQKAKGQPLSYDIITRSLIPTRYNSKETSGLNVEISPKGNRNISISLESK